jgi:hypothetical protein
MPAVMADASNVAIEELAVPELAAEALDIELAELAEAEAAITDAAEEELWHLTLAAQVVLERVVCAGGLGGCGAERLPFGIVEGFGGPGDCLGFGAAADQSSVVASPRVGRGASHPSVVVITNQDSTSSVPAHIFEIEETKGRYAAIAASGQTRLCDELLMLVVGHC